MNIIINKKVWKNETNPFCVTCLSLEFSCSLSDVSTLSSHVTVESSGILFKYLPFSTFLGF